VYYAISPEEEEQGLEGTLLPDLDTAITVSMSGCAQASYRKLDLSEAKAFKVNTKLLKGEIIHSSPAEHIGTPMSDPEWEIRSSMREDLIKFFIIGEGVTRTLAEQNADSVMFSGNLRGFAQHRKLIPNNYMSDNKELNIDIELEKKRYAY